MSNTHVFEAIVIRHEPYLQCVEAAMMNVALEVYTEPADTHGHEKRSHIAINMFTDTNEAAKFARAFAWLGLFNPDIRGQVFKGPNDIRPEDIDGDQLRTVIRNAWDVFANVQAEPEGSEG